MNPVPSKNQYRLGDLVVAAFDSARRTAGDRRAVSRLACRTVTEWLARSNRLDLIRSLALVESRKAP